MTPNKQFSTALTVEWMKFRRSPVVIITTLLLIVGLLAMCGALLYAIQSGNPQLIAKAGPTAAAGGWTGIFAIASQVVPTAGLLAFGVVAGWVFGREFTEGTVIGLFARPVSRTVLALAKFTILLLWIAACTLGLVSSLLLLGIALRLGPIDSALLSLAAKLVVVGVLTGLLALVAGLVATWTRGYLSAIGTIIGVVVLAVIASFVGVGGWFPYAAPGIWAATPSSTVLTLTMTIQLLLVVPVAAIIAALTVRAWSRLQL
ncbi:MAG: ABC transporter permease [Terrimesophilobacter sp.]